jgi:DNA polymerase I-like protein with 3'-5' exonuclease and polymerase domains
MPKVLTFVDSGPNQEAYKNILQSLMENVVEIPGGELSFAYWPGMDDAAAKIRRDDPDLTFICGETALNQMMRVKGIKRCSGKLMEWDDRPVVPLLSPGYISSHSKELAPYAESIQKAYMVASGEEFNEPENEFEIIHTFKELLPYLPYLSNASWVSFDFETTTLTDMATFDPNFRLRGLALTYQIGSAIFLDLENMSEDDLRHVAMALDEKVFGNPDIVKIGHNVKFDMHCAVVLGIKQFKGQFHCTMLMSQLLDENTPNGLKYLVSVYFPAFSGYEDKLQGTRWEDIPTERLAPYACLDSDLTLRLYLCFTNIMLERHPRIYNLFRNLTVPATKALFQAEQNGMLIDKEYIEEAILHTEADIIEQEQKLRSNRVVKQYQNYRDQSHKNKMITQLEDKMRREEEREFAETPADRRDKRVVALQVEMLEEPDPKKKSEYSERIAKEKAKKYGPTPKDASLKRIELLKKKVDAWRTGKVTSTDLINFGSSTQMNELIYGSHGFNFDPPQDPISGKPKSGTGKEVLNYIADRSGFLDNLLAYRQLTKILSTYLIAIRDRIDKDGKIHTSFNQHVAKTGRLSSSNPNLQNQISRTKYEVVEEAVKRVKKSFSVPEGYTLIQADYSQAELRLIAHYSQDKRMMKAYLNDQDLHELTAANAKGLTVEKWRELDPKEKKQSRFEAKSENFGLIYGMSAGGYRDYARVQYGIIMSKKKAEDRRDNFFELYPSLLDYHKTYKAKAYKFGHVRTMFGRKVRLPELRSFNKYKVGHAERNAINSPIQGTAGEMTIFAFSLLQPILDERVIFVNTIHDSILYYVPDDILDSTINQIAKVMENLPIEVYFDRTLSLPMKADFETSKKSWGDLAA